MSMTRCYSENTGIQRRRCQQVPHLPRSDLLTLPEAETTAPYSLISHEVWSPCTPNAAFSETSLTLSRFPDHHPSTLR